MKVAILAGGLGTRLAEETDWKPKPMVEIGGQPILWHIMMHYHRYGYGEFVVALGYKAHMIKAYMLNYSQFAGDLTLHFNNDKVVRTNEQPLDWTVHLIETGERTNTGGRIKRLAPIIGNETFMLTWGDGLSDVDLDALVAFHKSHGKLATLTAVRPPARFGHLDLDGDRIVEFSEKPQAAEGWINGAFFILSPEVFDYIEDDATQFEREPLEQLARDGQLMAYRHESFWQCMDTIRDQKLLERMWQSGAPPWKTW